MVKNARSDMPVLRSAKRQRVAQDTDADPMHVETPPVRAIANQPAVRAKQAGSVAVDDAVADPSPQQVAKQATRSTIPSLDPAGASVSAPSQGLVIKIPILPGPTGTLKPSVSASAIQDRGPGGAGTPRVPGALDATTRVGACGETNAVPASAVNASDAGGGPLPEIPLPCASLPPVPVAVQSAPRAVQPTGVSAISAVEQDHPRADASAELPTALAVQRVPGPDARAASPAVHAAVETSAASSFLDVDRSAIPVATQDAASPCANADLSATLSALPGAPNVAASAAAPLGAVATAASLSPGISPRSLSGPSVAGAGIAALPGATVVQAAVPPVRHDGATNETSPASLEAATGSGHVQPALLPAPVIASEPAMPTEIEFTGLSYVPDAVITRMRAIARYREIMSNRYALSTVPRTADWGRTPRTEKVLCIGGKPINIWFVARIHSLWFFDRNGDPHLRVNVGATLHCEQDLAAVSYLSGKARPRPHETAKTVYAGRLCSHREKGEYSHTATAFTQVYDATTRLTAKSAMPQLSPVDLGKNDIAVIECHLTRWKRASDGKAKKTWNEFDVGFELNTIYLLYSAPADVDDGAGVDAADEITVDL